MVTWFGVNYLSTLRFGRQQGNHNSITTNITHLLIKQRNQAIQAHTLYQPLAPIIPLNSLIRYLYYY